MIALFTRAVRSLCHTQRYKKTTNRIITNDVYNFFYWRWGCGDDRPRITDIPIGWYLLYGRADFGPGQGGLRDYGF